MTRDERLERKVHGSLMRAVQKYGVRPSPLLLEQLANAGLALLGEGNPSPNGEECLRRVWQNTAIIAMDMMRARYPPLKPKRKKK